MTTKDLNKKVALKQSKSYYGEDRLVLKGNHLFGVIDGATPLYKNGSPKQIGSNNKTWASWLVSTLKRNLEKGSDSIYEVFENTSKMLYDKFTSVNPKDKAYFPSCNFAFAEFDEEKEMVTITQIGDCEAFVKFKNNKFERIMQPELYALDAYAISEMVKRGGKKDSIMDILRYNRGLMNEENGYASYTLSSNPNFKYTIKTYNLADIEEIYLYSDGIGQAFDELKITSSPEELFNKYSNINDIVSDIVTVANTDKDLKKYPRFKKIDDISIIKLY